MEKDFPLLNEEERLLAENDYMKMKLMLEKGAQFGAATADELDPAIENQFLKNVIEFEKQFDEHKTIRVFDKIGRPSHFKPVAQIPDTEIVHAWEQVHEYLYRHAIDLNVCSPNISARELYRFATEELFEYQMDDVNIPGMINGFIYDEFYPDPVYDNTRIAIEDCMTYILEKEHIHWTHHFRKKDLRLNHHYPLTIEELKMLINRFKDAHEELELVEIKNSKCIIENNNCTVTGEYCVNAATTKEKYQLAGGWEVDFEWDSESAYWYITAIQVGKIYF